MSSIPVADVITAITKVGAELGADLLPLFTKHEPRLRTEPIAPEDEAMTAAREKRIAELEAEGKTSKR